MTTTPPPILDQEIIGIRRAQVGRYGIVDPTKPYSDTVAFGKAVAQARDAQWQECIQKLEAEIAALKPDAERLDFLQRISRCDPKMDGNHVWWPTSFNVAQTLKGSTIRAAIDAARAALENKQ